MGNNKPLLAHLCLFGSGAFWGLMAPVGKDAMTHGIEGIDMVSFRVLGGAILFWLTSLFTRREHIPTTDIIKLAGAGLFGLVFNQCCYTIGLSIAAESRSCINIWDEVNKVKTEFLEPGFTLTEEDFAGFEEKFRNLVKEAKVVAMSGSVPKGLDGTAYQRLIKIVKEAGIPVILDTSGKLLEMGIEAAPTMIKPNIDEIRMLTGKKCDNIQDIIDAAKEIHAKGVEIVAVSLGADGSLAVGNEGIFRALVPRINAVNTVGCGDSMIAGFALGLSRRLSLPETMKLASAISAAAAMREETGFFVMEDMEKLLPQIEVTKL